MTPPSTVISDSVSPIQRDIIFILGVVLFLTQVGLVIFSHIIHNQPLDGLDITFHVVLLIAASFMLMPTKTLSLLDRIPLPALFKRAS